jgi:DNA repair ATPase RecN
MITNIQQAKTRLTLSTPIDLPEVKQLIKDLYNQIEELQNEIRKVSENRPRANKDSGRTIQAP